MNGFPTGSDSAWSLAEQRELRTFLQIVTGQSKTKFLLTSRRDEDEWLGNVPARITLPPMPLQESFELTREIAKKQEHRITVVEDWLPLLKFARGNPMTLTVVVGQALRDGKKTRVQIEEYVQQLRNGEVSFKDETSEGRSKSLGASLSYAFEQVFSENECKVLALLHFFQGFVNAQVIRVMLTDEDWGLGNKDFTDQKAIAILDKAADIGLLTSHGGGYYTIHPALPWFFRVRFEEYYPNEVPVANHQPSTEDWRATRAYVESMGDLGEYYMTQYDHGKPDVIAPPRAEESNLLHARSLARQRGWWNALTRTMMGLDPLYYHTGRLAERKRLLEETMQHFIGSDNLPIAGRDEQWKYFIRKQVMLAIDEKDWQAAEQTQKIIVKYARASMTDENTKKTNTKTIHFLARSLHDLGEIQREIGDAECVKNYEECLHLDEQINETAGMVACAFNLGNAYKDLPTLRNLDEAERWYKRALELDEPSNKIGRAREIGQLGNVAYTRFNDAKKEGKAKEELLKHLNTAVDYYQQTLALLPPDAVHDLAVTHAQFGSIYNAAGVLDKALDHKQQAGSYFEKENDLYDAGRIRFEIAIMFAQNGRLSDALLYARAALRNFESYGGRAMDWEDRTKGLITDIEEAMKE